MYLIDFDIQSETCVNIPLQYLPTGIRSLKGLAQLELNNCSQKLKHKSVGIYEVPTNKRMILKHRIKAPRVVKYCKWAIIHSSMSSCSKNTKKRRCGEEVVALMRRNDCVGKRRHRWKFGSHLYFSSAMALVWLGLSLI